VFNLLGAWFFNWRARQRVQAAQKAAAKAVKFIDKLAANEPDNRELRVLQKHARDLQWELRNHQVDLNAQHEDIKSRLL